MQAHLRSANDSAIARKMVSWFATRDDAYISIIFCICLLMHFTLSLVGWENTLCDRHGFRQTQTALTTYYVLQEGPRIDYSTPVLGKPWSIPMEFPLYEWIVAAVARISKMALDQAGRFVSLLFFYLSLPLVFFVSGEFLAQRKHKLVLLCLLLASPLYIFWSRAFLIESVALFSGLLFLTSAVRWAKRPGPMTLLAAWGFGAISGITKITTFAAFLLPILFLLARYWLRRFPRHVFSFSGSIPFISHCFMLFIVPFAASACWIVYTDSMKSLNPIAAHNLTAYAYRFWNIGTINQFLSIGTWLSIWNMASEGIAKYWFTPLYAALFIVARKYRIISLLLLFSFWWAPFIFTNLYFMHDYYYYANLFFLVLSMGFLIVSLLETDRGKTVTQFIALPLFLFVMYRTYLLGYYPIQKKNVVSHQPLARAIQTYTDPQGILLIYGLDWSSVVPYYSQRRALMDRDDLPFTHVVFQRALKELGSETISAMVLSGNKRYDRDFINDRIQNLALWPTPVFSDQTVDLYITRQRHERAL